MSARWEKAPCTKCGSKDPPRVGTIVRYLGAGWLVRTVYCVVCGAQGWISQKVGH